MIRKALSIFRNIVLVLLTFATVAVGSLWIVSCTVKVRNYEYTGVDIWSPSPTVFGDNPVDQAGRQRRIAAIRGRLHIDRWNYQVSGTPIRDWELHLPGFVYRQSFVVFVETAEGPVVSPFETRSIQCHLSFLVLLFAAYPTLAFLRGPFRRHRRRKRGLCITCGYNLTGNESGVCPECGDLIPKQD